MNEIAILSGKGGTGKTSLSAAFATMNGKMVIADCDVEAANLGIILQPEYFQENRFVTGHKAVIDQESCSQCGICLTYCRFGAISEAGGRISIAETTCDGCRLCARMCPERSIIMVPRDKSKWFSGPFRNGWMVHARLEPGEENSGKLVNIVRERARELVKETGLNTLVIDGPPGMGCPVISSVTGVKKAIVVTEPTRSGFHDMRRILELTGNFKVKSYVVINKYDLNPDMASQIFDWCTDRKIPVAGTLPFDPQLVDAMVHCKSICEWRPESDVSKEIIRIWHKINQDE